MRNPLFRFFAIGLEKILARWTDVLCVVAQADEGKGLKAGIIPRRKYVLARCGIRTETFSPDDRGRARTQLGFQADDHVVGMVACLKPQKAPTDFVKLAAVVKRKMPKAKFMLVGDGVLRNDLERQIRAAGLEKDIVLTGWRQDVPALLSIMDVFVLTSLWEGLSIAVLEAMAAQVPVVVTDTGGVRDVVDDGRTGFLMAQGDVLGMCEKIVTLAKAPVLKRQMVEAAKARVMAEEFSLPKTVRAVEMVYGEMIGKGHDVR
jgi:glycosyltransferase involved in cell wall biosynthesis